MIAAAALFLLFAGVGAAMSYLRNAQQTTDMEDTDSALLANLENYARSIETEKPAVVAAADENLLPDVNTMIGRLAARLEDAPQDVQGWRMLGWSYFNMERYQEAAVAYARAVELDPSSAELKLAYEEAKARVSEAARSGIAAPLQTGAVAKKAISSEEGPAHERDAAIRSMVDGLAYRLESSPRDVAGWTRLMRSRVVLGEMDVAATALRKALEVFKDDSASSGRIMAAALELGLKAE
ncbi:tetratricopeptide repeat protein [Hyphomicrobium sp. CS1GBMeth3]|uniref:tetratricopeptide repeat protein n=1 Tax=Hyphomicrobium sp. CS1GBMeth3 TaxID=1892845 RepID=UPI00092FE0D4|nr:tetratricopeptide repeat protein [Hyphomicrobium sp. CS1GBMeth3]